MQNNKGTIFTNDVLLKWPAERKARKLLAESMRKILKAERDAWKRRHIPPEDKLLKKE